MAAEVVRGRLPAHGVVVVFTVSHVGSRVHIALVLTRRLLSNAKLLSLGYRFAFSVCFIKLAIGDKYE